TSENPWIPGLVLRTIPEWQSVASYRPEMTDSYNVTSLAALALLHAGVERVARGVADQIDAQDRGRQQQPRPEDQRRLDLEIGASLRHDVAPGRGLRADAGAEKRQDRLGENGGRADVGALHDQRRD